jgi:hypothetical protein
MRGGPSRPGLYFQKAADGMAAPDRRERREHTEEMSRAA